jgi:hypothetical protein
MSGLRADARGRRHDVLIVNRLILLSAAALSLGSPGAVAAPNPALAAPILVAQAGPPIRLTPPPRATTAPADDATPAKPAPEVPPPATDTPAAPLQPGDGSKSAIEVTQPPPVSTESVGLLDPGQARLPDTLWKGSARAAVEHVMDDVPVATVSRPARDLARRVLVTAAAPPAGEDAVKGRSFVSARAAKLFAMGDIEDAGGLARLVPARDEDEALARLQLDSTLAAYDNAGACNVVRTHIARFGTPYWQKALIFCQLLANEQDRAQLGVSILHEQQVPEDAAFEHLVARLSGDKRATVDKLPEPTPLHLAMMRAANIAVPGDLATSSDPVILRMVATSPNASADQRVTAAERAEAYGALPSETLAQAYEGITLTADQIDNALSLAQSDRGPRGRAALHRAAKAKPIGAQRAELLQGSWRLARERGGYATAVRVDLPLLLEMPPDPELLFFAADATRALLFAGKPEDARRWYTMVRSEAASGNALAGTAEALLSPLFWLADPAEQKANTPPLAQRFEAWRKAQASVDEANLVPHSALLVTLLSATGDAPDQAMLNPLLAGKTLRTNVPMPNMGLWLGLGAAFDAGRIGETALFGLAALGPDGAAGSAPQTTALVLDAFRAASLDADARAIAVETAIAGGL